MSATTEKFATGNQNSVAADGKDNHFLTFSLAGEQYGVDILRVQEIRGWERATPLPDTADYIRGVINLRGVVVPIIDLRLRFKKEPIPDTGTTVVIVVKVIAQQGEKIIGILVDAVSDVRKAGDDELKPAPDLEMGRTGLVKGLAMLENEMIILLDIDRLVAVSSPEINAEIGQPT